MRKPSAAAQARSLQGALAAYVHLKRTLDRVRAEDALAEQDEWARMADRARRRLHLEPRQPRPIP